MWQFLAGAGLTALISVVTQVVAFLRHRDEVRLRESQLRLTAKAQLHERTLDAYEQFYGLLQKSIEEGRFDYSLYEKIMSKFMYIPADLRNELVAAFGLLVGPKDTQRTITSDERSKLAAARASLVAGINTIGEV